MLPLYFINSKREQMNKLCNVVMLPTEKAMHSFQILLYKRTGVLNYYQVSQQGLDSDSNLIAQHLYITSDDEIKEGDWFIVKYKGQRLEQCTNILPESSNTCITGNQARNYKRNECTKVIATTDPDLTIDKGHRCLDQLPQIPEVFCEAYSEAGGIDEVLVEYTKVPADRAPDGWSISLKLREDNTIIIHQAMTYSRGKVEQLLHTAVNDSHCGKDRVKSASSNNCAKFVIDWIKENL